MGQMSTSEFSSKESKNKDILVFPINMLIFVSERHRGAV